MFKKILAFFMTAVIAASMLCVTAGAAGKIKLNNVKNASSGNKVSATMKKADPIDFKVTLSEKSDLAVNFSANAKYLYIYVYNSSLKSAAPVEPTMTKGSYEGKCLDDSGYYGYLGDGIELRGDTSNDCAGKLVFKNLSKGTYYVRFYMGSTASGSGKLNVTMTFADGGDKSGKDSGSSKKTGKITDFSFTLDKGDKVKLNAITDPSNAAVTWSSSNEKVATVTSSGKVTAKGKGTAVITAKSGSNTKTIKIIVED